MVQKKPAKSVFIYVVCTVGALTGFLFGFDSGIISGAILFIKQDFLLSSGQQEIIISAVLYGAIVGAALSGRLSDHFGRRALLIVSAIIFIFGTLISAFAHGAINLAIGRLLLGFAIGVTSSVAPVYLSELSPSHIRGGLIALYQLAITLGIFVSYIVDWVFSKSGNWHWMLGLGVVPAVVLFIGMLFLPKSPRWVMSKGLVDQAREILIRLRGTHEVEQEIEEIRHTLEEEGRANWKLLFSRWARPALVVALGMAILQQLVGINTIIYYSTTIFNMIGFGGPSGATEATMIIGLVNFVATIFGVFLIDKIGRRPLVIFGFVVMFLSHLSLSIAFRGTTVAASLHWLALTGMICFIIGFAISIGIISWVLNAEVFPLRIRGLGSSVAATGNWVFNALVSSTFLTLVTVFGAGHTFFMYAIICLVGLLLVLFFMPETKGITLERLEQNLHKGVSMRNLGKH